ncbi:MAG: D-aminoacyl-tRNA deacylase [Spirochaetaceae bacterium]
MRAVVTRVSHARVTCRGSVSGEIQGGIMALVGISTQDREDDVNYIARKIHGLRIFDDADGVMNQSIAEAGGSVLLISQFTLYGNARKGRRPSYNQAAAGAYARPLFDALVQKLSDYGLHVETGVFGGPMSVESTNEGPVTILLSSEGEF